MANHVEAQNRRPALGRHRAPCPTPGTPIAAFAESPRSPIGRRWRCSAGIGPGVYLPSERRAMVPRIRQAKRTFLPVGAPEIALTGRCPCPEPVRRRAVPWSHARPQRPDPARRAAQGAIAGPRSAPRPTRRRKRPEGRRPRPAGCAPGQAQSSPTRDRSGGDNSDDGSEGRGGGRWRLGRCKTPSPSRYEDGTQGDADVDCFGDARDPKGTMERTRPDDEAAIQRSAFVPKEDTRDI